MNKELAKIINQSIQSGDSLNWNYSLIAKEQKLNGPVVPVRVEIKKEVTSISILSGLFGGSSLAAAIPEGVLPPFHLTLDSLVFDLFTNTKTVGGIHGYLAMGKGGSGMSLSIARIGQSDVSITLSGLTISWVDPQRPKASILAISFRGSFKVGELYLEVLVSLPQGQIQISQPEVQSISIGDFFSQLRLPSVEFLSKLFLQNFQFLAILGSHSFSLSADIGTDSNDSLTLISAADRTILALDEMSFSFSHAPGNTKGIIRGSLVFMEKLVLNASASVDISSGTWHFTGNINVPATAIKLGVPPKDGQYTVPVIKLLTESFGINEPNLPEPLRNLGISYLEVSYTYTKDGGEANTCYSFKGALASHWQLASNDMRAQVELLLEKGQDYEKKAISAQFEMDGFAFSLGCELANKEKKIDASISAEIQGQWLIAKGTYRETSEPPQRADKRTTKTIDFEIESLPSLGALMAWFVKSITQNHYYTLPEPWHSLLNAVDFSTVLRQLTFNIEIITSTDPDAKTQKKVFCQLTPPDDLSILNVKVKTISLGFDNSKKGKKASGLSFKIDLESNLPFLNKKEFDWDPVNEQPPQVPGKGPLLDLKLLALGQHINFDPTYNKQDDKFIVPPTSISEAIYNLKKVVHSLSDNSSPALTFDKQAGWVVGAHAKFLGQADVQLVFMDPVIYGLQVEVNRGKNQTLNKLAGLRAEILYRKVTETIGEYKGSITLPKNIRKMQFGVVFITLPSISVSIYTNGDFAFDVGFPHHHNYANSFSVTAKGFTGAGGFYFAKLNGIQPKGLPESNNGSFTSVTQVGVGFKIGRAVAFQKGPLSARASIVLEAVFQGTFATFTTKSGNRKQEYYDIKASLGIICHIEGRINFAVIQASLTVTAFVRAEAHLVAAEACHAKVEAYVSVSITVRINLGIFSIHIHCSFSTSFQTQVTLGSADPNALWKRDPVKHLPQAIKAQGLILTGSPTNHRWQPISKYFPFQLPVLLLPQPTSTSPGEWFYVCQFAIYIDLENDPNLAAYGNLVKGLVAWTLYNLTEPEEAGDYDELQSSFVKAEKIAQFTKAVNGKVPSTVFPSIVHVQKLFSSEANSSALFDLNINLPDVEGHFKKRRTPKSAFFPALPGTLVMINETAPEPSLGLGEVRNAQEEVFMEFVKMTICNALGKAEEKGIVPRLDEDDESNELKDVEIKKVIDSLDKETIVAIAGLTTRFMLHGNRRNGEALYKSTGQQVRFLPKAQARNSFQGADTPDTSDGLHIKVSFQDTDAWGHSLKPLIVSSTSKKPIILRPSAFSGPNSPIFNSQEFSEITFLPLTHVQNERLYPIRSKVAVSQTESIENLYHFPELLIQGLFSGKVKPDMCQLMAMSTSGNDNPQEITPLSYITTVDFKISRIPLPTQTGKEQAYIKDTYLLSSVNQSGLLRLKDLIIDLKNLEIKKMNLGFTEERSPNQIKLVPVDGENVFMLQANFSTQTNPPHAFFKDVYEKPDLSNFVKKLWTGGITNTGGYYLYWGGDHTLPESAFDLEQVAEVSAVISTKDLKPYSTGVMLNAQASTDDSLWLANRGEKVVLSYFQPGKIPIRVVRKKTVTYPDPFLGLLDNLYNLLQIELICDGMPKWKQTLGPKNKSVSEKHIWYYDHVFSVVQPWSPKGQEAPSDSMNPYAMIQQEKLPTPHLKPLDLFGNLRAEFSIESSLSPMHYTDPVMSLAQLPFLDVGYDFAAKDQISLRVSLSEEDIKNMLKEGSGPSLMSELKEHLWSYAQMIYQLSDPEVKIEVLTTFAMQVDNSRVKVHLKENLTAAYKKLLSIYKQETDLSRSDFEKDTSTFQNILVDIEHLNQNRFFPLGLWLKISRTAHLPDDLSRNSDIARSIQFVGPILNLEVRNTSGESRLFPFAQHIQEYYASDALRLAVGVAEQKDFSCKASFLKDKGVFDHLNNQSGDQLWILRYGKPGQIRIELDSGPNQKINYYTYSPRPLSNRLLSLNANAVNIDLDEEMRAFLLAIDDIFTPEKMVVVAKASSDDLNRLSNYKKTLVEKLIGYISPTQIRQSLAEPKKTMEAAQELYKQECLKELSNFYRMDAAVVFKMAKNDGFQNKMQFHVSPKMSGSESEEAALTNGKAAIPGNQVSYLPLGVFPKQTGQKRVFKTSLQLKLNALEHGIEKVTVTNNDSKTKYFVGSWLKFITSSPQVLAGNSENIEITIPLPLRAFPTPPVLEKLYYEGLSADTPSDSNEDLKLLFAKSWSLNTDFSLDYVAQDQLIAEITTREVKVPDQAWPVERKVVRKDQVKKTLLETLIDFKTDYQGLRNTLASLNKVDPAKVPDDISRVLHKFVNLVEAVCNSNWAQAPGAAEQMPAVSSIRSTQKSKVLLKFENIEKGWKVDIAPFGDKNHLNFSPQLQMPGYQLESVKKINGLENNGITVLLERTAENPSDVSTKQRSIRVTPYQEFVPKWPIHRNSEDLPFNIMATEGGKIALKVRRNSTLPPAFRYETSYVTFSKEVIPQLTVQQPIYIHKLTGVSQGHPQKILSNFFEKLYLNYYTGKQTPWRLFAMEIVVNFEYQVNVASVSLPILLLPPSDLSVELQSAMLIREVRAWINANYGSIEIIKNNPDLCESWINFDISLFTSQSADAVLRLKNIRFNTKYINFDSP